MKKENFYLSGVIQKFMVGAFLLFGLLLLSPTTLSAQYMSGDAAMKAIHAHMDGIADQGIVKEPQSQTIGSKEQAVMPTLRKAFGEMLSSSLRTGNDVDQALATTTARFESRLTESTVSTIRSEYVELLKD